MLKYIKKPVVIEAVQLFDTPKSIHEVQSFIEGHEIINNQASSPDDKFHDYCGIVSKQGGILFKTLESDGERQKADFGDYIIKGIKGEFYPCKPDIFELTYEQVNN